MECIPGTEIPKPRVALVGSEGNAYAIIGKVRRALRKANAPAEVISEYLEKSMQGDYDNLLAVATEYADVS